MTNEEQEAMVAIIEALGKLGWVASFNSESDDVRYMIIGESDAVDKIVNKIEE